MSDQPQLNIDRFDALMSDVLEGSASPDQIELFNECLRQDPKARLRYIAYIDLHATLADPAGPLKDPAPDDLPDVMSEIIDQALALRRQHEIEDEANKQLAAQQAEDARNRRFELRRRQPEPQPGKREIVIPQVVVWLGLAAVLGIAATVVYQVNRPAPQVTSPPMAEQAPDTQQPQALAPVVATVRTAVDARWVGHTDVNGRLRRGQSITLTQGFAEVHFGSGARVVIEAPATLTPTGPNAMALASGRVSVTAPPSATGFTVDTHDARVIDVGTEFGVEAAAHTPSYIQVFKGKVYAARVTDDIVEDARAPLVRGQALRVEPGERRLDAYVQPIGPEHHRFARSVDEAALAQLAYARSVLADQPVLYWRFESEGEGANPLTSAVHASDRLALTGDVTATTQDGHGRLEFTPARGQRAYAELVGPLPYLGGSPTYTLECWVRPERVAKNPVLSLREFAVDPGNARSAALLELASGQDDVTERTVRFIQRTPPEKEGSEEAIGTQPYAAGHWIHVVAVKTDTQRLLYVNGQLVGAVQDSRPLADEPLAMILGYHATGAEETLALRQFVGGLDEFALYPHALTAEQVADHYTAGAPLFRGEDSPN